MALQEPSDRAPQALGPMRLAPVPIEDAEVRHRDGKLLPRVAIDRTSKSAYAGPHAKARPPIAVQMLSLIEAMPDRIHTVPTVEKPRPNRQGIHLTHEPGTSTHGMHSVDRSRMVTNGQVERVSRTTRDAMVRTTHQASVDAPKQRLHPLLTGPGGKRAADRAFDDAAGHP